MAENVQGSGGGSWSKWQIALVIGAPLAIGATAAAVYCYSKSGGDSANKCKDGDEKKKSGGSGEKASVSASGDGDPSSLQPDQTPLEKAQASKNRGNKYFKAAHYDQAIRCYSEAIEICPADKKQDLATFYQNRAAAHEQQGKYAEVIADCSKAIELNPTYTKAMFRRAKAHDHNGDKLLCLEDTTAVCILEGFNHQQGMMLADRMLKEIGKEKAKERYKNRVPQLPSGQFIQSYFSSFSNDGISQKADMPPVEDGQELRGYLKAKQLFHDGSYDEIVQNCIEEIEYRGKYQYEALLMKATFFLLMGQAEWAVPDLDELIKNEDAAKKLRANALIKRGSMHMQEGNSAAAMADFAAAVEIDPENPDIYHHRGQLNLLLEKVDEAVKDFEKCNELNNDFGLAYAQHSYAKYRLAMLQQSPLQMQNAMQMLEKCTTRFPKCAEGFALLAQAQNEQGLYVQADDNFKKAVMLEPDNPTAHVHRGLLHLNWKKDVAGAIDMIKEALKIDEKCDFAYETLGTIEVQRGNMDAAKEYFENAIQLARTEMEMTHLYSLSVAAEIQSKIAKKLNIKPQMPFT
ncbi:mitochondrial import receptor subunit TOM70-like [Anneissia japonica]|uniref:mitochondrial import receptor subunit TOM70-like n=1 Tax=Anneissia japonica TaxID=1529436 RepID=UPI0014256622|nr:mitochondrial import receptor subunit TOM70-like [Anneissia japonica]